MVWFTHFFNACVLVMLRIYSPSSYKKDNAKTPAKCQSPPQPATSQINAHIAHSSCSSGSVVAAAQAKATGASRFGITAQITTVPMIATLPRDVAVLVVFVPGETALPLPGAPLFCTFDSITFYEGNLIPRLSTSGVYMGIVLPVQPRQFLTTENLASIAVTLSGTSVLQLDAPEAPLIGSKIVLLEAGTIGHVGMPLCKLGPSTWWILALLCPAGRLQR